MTIKILPQAKPLYTPFEAIADPAAKKIFETTLKDLAGTDGDRVLDTFEAVELKAAYDAILPQGGPITEAVATEIHTALSTRIASMKAERANATDAIFTSEGQALEVFRTKIMATITDTVAKANGKKVDVDMMIFAFTDKVLADEIVTLAKAHPNVNFRLLTDWSQLATSGDRQAPRLAKIAADEGLTNIEIKFKKDDPYVWSSSAGRPVFSHGATKGLNHHKGFVTSIEGRPEKMTFGSFNWSMSAMTGNYENLMLLDRKDPDNRPIMKGYKDEFVAFWNDDASALTMSEARKEKERLYKALYDANNVPYTPSVIADGPADVPYVADDKNAAFDINSFADVDSKALTDVIGSSLAKKIQKELRDFGRFDSYTELLARVPDVASASTWAREHLSANLEFGEGGLSVNTANADELARAGLTKTQAARIIEMRTAKGSFESVEEIDDVVGIAAATMKKARLVLTDDEGIGTYSARKIGGPATTGWSETNHGTLAVPTTGDTGTPRTDGKVIPTNRDEMTNLDRDLAAPVIDLLRRAKPGDTFRISMYGLSKTSPEYAEMEKALARGVKMRVVIYKSYNEGTIAALKELKAQGFDVDTRVIKSRVMHEKFGVINDDVFNGSANMSTSSITKHSEDRFLFRNMPDLAHRFVEEFARLWEKGTAP